MLGTIFTTITDRKGKIRVVDEQGFTRRVAALCVKSHENVIEILLITSKASDKSWIIPGGGIEPGESSEDAVKREAMEEAGVICKKTGLLGSVERTEKKEGKEKKERTEVFQMTVTEELDEWDESKENKRLRQWFPIQVAREKIREYRSYQLDYLDLL